MRRLLMLLLLLAALVPVSIVVAGDSSDPGRPDWVDPAGKVKKNKVPAEFGVAGHEGTPVVCANGKELKVKKEKLLAPPPNPSKQATAPDEEYVWRCGTGENPHLNARLVPDSRDPLEKDDG